MMALRYGIARGLFSNEAGLGSAPMVHCAADTDHPVRQGMYGVFEVFVDTLLICTATALVIL
jgi:alanine or glycine:cation symporter, AGCS family